MKAVLEVGERRYDYFPIAAAVEGAARLPYSLKVLLENLVRYGEDARAILEPGAEIGRACSCPTPRACRSLATLRRCARRRTIRAQSTRSSPRTW